MKNKYSKYKILHYNDKLLSLPKENSEIKSPIHIRIKPTNVCNHACWYCSYQSLDEIQLGKDMVVKDIIPKDKMLEIIDDCIDMGVEAITFSGGGEPFAYPHFLEVVKKLSQSDIKFASLTNGSYLKGEIAELFANNAQWLRISVDGWDAQSYASYRKVKESAFENLVNNIKNFKALKGSCSLGISYIIDNKNYLHIYEFIKLMKESGADSIKLSPCIVADDGKINNEYHQPIFEKTKEIIAQAIKDFESKDFEIYDTYHALEEKFEKDYSWCPYLQILPIIGADLNIYSCQDKAYNLDTGLVGDIKEKSFKEFWFSDKNKFFKIDPSKVCNHHCIANEKNKMILDFIDLDENHLPFV
jgi:MoaA/NifB/PqqE/SkfB family radical SAM enzyme